MSAFKLWLSCFFPVQAMAGGCHVSALMCCPKAALAGLAIVLLAWVRDYPAMSAGAYY